MRAKVVGAILRLHVAIYAALHRQALEDAQDGDQAAIIWLDREFPDWRTAQCVMNAAEALGAKSDTVSFLGDTLAGVAIGTSEGNPCHSIG